MSYTPTKSLGKALEILRNTIAASSTFRALVGETTTAEARKRVVYPAAAYRKRPGDDRSLLIPRPRAIVKLAPGWAYRSIGVGSYAHVLSLAAIFEFPAPAAESDEPIKGDDDTEWLWFHDKWKGIVDDMVALMRAGVDDASNRMLASDSPVRVFLGPDVQEPEEDLIDEEFHYVGLQFDVDVPSG